jgi:hypothetical protein
MCRSMSRRQCSRPNRSPPGSARPKPPLPYAITPTLTLLPNRGKPQHVPITLSRAVERFLQLDVVLAQPTKTANATERRPTRHATQSQARPSVPHASTAPIAAGWVGDPILNDLVPSPKAATSHVVDRMGESSAACSAYVRERAEWHPVNGGTGGHLEARG